MNDDEDERPQDKKGFQRQFDIEKRQFDRAFEEQVAMRHGTRGDREIKQCEEIAEPEARADAGRIDDRGAQ